MKCYYLHHVVLVICNLYVGNGHSLWLHVTMCSLWQLAIEQVCISGKLMQHHAVSLQQHSFLVLIKFFRHFFTCTDHRHVMNNDISRIQILSVIDNSVLKHANFH